MSQEYDNTNKGRMWSAGYHTLLHQGELNVEGKDIQVAIVEKKNKDGSTTKFLYKSIGKIFDSNNQDILYDTTFQVNNTGSNETDYKLWIREKTSKAGTDYLALSCKEKQDATKF